MNIHAVWIIGTLALVCIWKEVQEHRERRRRHERLLRPFRIRFEEDKRFLFRFRNQVFSAKVYELSPSGNWVIFCGYDCEQQIPHTIWGWLATNQIEVMERLKDDDDDDGGDEETEPQPVEPRFALN